LGGRRQHDTDEFENIAIKAIKEDPPGEPQGHWILRLPFAIAIFYVLFGLVAMIAWLGSIL